MVLNLICEINEFQYYHIESASEAVFSEKNRSNPNHRIHEGSYSIPTLKTLYAEDIDGYLQVTDEEVITTTRCLAQDEGIVYGFSSEINVVITLQLLKGH